MSGGVTSATCPRSEPLIADATAIFRAGVRAVDPRSLVRRALAGVRLTPPVAVLAVGKAGIGMARGALAVLGRRAGEALVVVPEGSERRLARARVLAAPHPLPAARTRKVAQAVVDFVGRPPGGGTLLALLSGGASALLTLPVPGLGYGDLRRVTRALLEASVPIDEVNAIRRRLGRLADGGLGALVAAPEVRVLALSDVPGDAIEVIGSGPFHPLATAGHLELPVLVRRRLGTVLVRRVAAVLRAAPSRRPPEPVWHRIVGSATDALAGAAREARRRGYRVRVLGRTLEGDAAAAGIEMAARILEARGGRVALLAAGETTVDLGGGRHGRGGRCQELALAAAIRLEEAPDVVLLAAGSDGKDGDTDAAGAIADGGSAGRARRRGVSAGAALRRHDSHRFFGAAGGLLRTGPTGTNVADLVVALGAG